MTLSEANIILDISECKRTTPHRNIIYLCAHTDFVMTKQPPTKPEFKDIINYIINCNNYGLVTM
jgi:hypothetical protein